MLEISTIFSIDIAAYAILNYHYHVVVHIDQDRANKWSIREVCNRWHKLFAGNDLSRRFIKGEILSSDEENRLTEISEKYKTKNINKI